MSCRNDQSNLESSKLKLKSMFRIKLALQKDVSILNNEATSLSSKITNTRYQIEDLSAELEDLQKRISEIRHQNSLIEICETSEKSKIDAHISSLNCYSTSFEEMFKKEKNAYDAKIKELKEREHEVHDAEMMKQMHIYEKTQQIQNEASTIENEAKVIEGQCTVLKKRNNAIMLKLRRKLVETEEARRELIQKKKDLADL